MFKSYDRSSNDTSSMISNIDWFPLSFNTKTNFGSYLKYSIKTVLILSKSSSKSSFALFVHLIIEVIKLIKSKNSYLSCTKSTCLKFDSFYKATICCSLISQMLKSSMD